MKGELSIRSAQPEDVGQLLVFMRALAEFEGYITDFKVSESELRRRCFVNQDFHVLVAEMGDELIGMLVYYTQPFTYDLAPWFVIKELFVHETARGLGAGRRLMKEAALRCVEEGGSRLRWEVLVDNPAARSFYSSLGAQADTQWQTWHLSRSRLVNFAHAGD
ncbi:MAG: GNAT family N-acetyltransferase [Gammaproteobacteria bacterium]|nr:GNAT family N-acetyltransferase [Gammaproteobacteria bacterium]MDP2139594.1 GNAT family N-acetyltransferase [Gammaproteobacteria bacterium]MDP2346567.1 GNAT family N-acetyltransferase [Gammaproteobacteria bacterium]